MTISAIVGVRRIVFVTYPDTTLLDVVGPAEVFRVATELGADPAYDLVVVSTDGGPVRSSSGLVIESRPIAGVRGSLDTLMAVGGTGVVPALDDRRLMRGVARLATRRPASSPACAPAPSCSAPPGCSTVAGSPRTGPAPAPSPAGSRRWWWSPIASSCATATCGPRRG